MRSKALVALAVVAVWSSTPTAADAGPCERSSPKGTPRDAKGCCILNTKSASDSPKKGGRYRRYLAAGGQRDSVREAARAAMRCANAPNRPRRFPTG